MDQRRFNLIKNFSLGSSVAIIIAAILLGWMYRILAIDELKNQGERYNTVLAHAIYNAVWPQVKEVMKTVPVNGKFTDEEKNYSIIVLDNAIKELLGNTNVLRIKIFSKNGRVIYSTNHEQIGLMEQKEYFNSNATTQGKNLTKLGYKEAFQSIKGNIKERNILESYLPINGSDNRAVEGIFEIYTDMTDSYRYMEKRQITFMSVLGGILAIVYLTLFIVVRNADNVIKKQVREREGYLHEIESVNLDLDNYAKELALARDMALGASKAKSAFLANMSHELRTPLNAILGYSEMMAEEMDSEGRDSELNDLNKIKTAGRHLLSLINDILDLSKIEAGQMELHLEDIDVPSAISHVIETVRPSADREQNVLELSIADDIGEMYTDQTRLFQILLNLLSNACKFTKDGVISLDVRRQQDDSSMLVFTVKDTGVGMHEDQLNKIFEAFKQADLSTTKEFGGTGLGLTISKRLCEMLGGEISVSSKLGKGSIFRMKLPERFSVIKGQNAGTVHQMVSPEGVRLNKSEIFFDERRSKISEVLIIDDDIEVSNLVTYTLASQGFKVSVINDASKAIEAAAEILPDVILLDVVMPEVYGWDILKGIKQHNQLNSIPVIMMTAVDNYTKADSLGADGFIIKPITQKKLMNAITLCLRSQQLNNVSSKVMAS